MKIKVKPWNGQPAKYITLKMDGNFTRITTGELGTVTVETSLPTDITAKCKGYDWLRPHYARLPFGTVVLGELYVPGKTCSVIKTALNEHWPDLMFSAFAVETMPEEAPLEDVSKYCLGYGIDFLRWRRTTVGDTVEQLFRDLPIDAEGYVLKDGNMLNLYKLKPVKTIDLIVDNFMPGAGKYFGKIGSLMCSVHEGIEIASVSGMTDEVRDEISANKSKYKGRVCEVAYQAVGARGRLRHPRFIRWRDDKIPLECTLDQDSELERIWRI